MKVTDEQKFLLILDAANEGIENAKTQGPSGVDALAAISAARRAIEKYEEILKKQE